MANASGFSGKTLPLREDAILMNSLGICVSLHFAPQITTDAKVIPALVARRLDGGVELTEAFRSTVASFEGSVAIAALRAPRLTQVGRSDHSGVLRLYAKRNSDLGRARNRTACRLHALLAELVAGGIPKEINANSAQRLLESVTPASAVERARHALACEHLEDLPLA